MSSFALNHKPSFLATLGDVLLISFAVGCIALLVTFAGEPSTVYGTYGHPATTIDAPHPAQRIGQD